MATRYFTDDSLRFLKNLNKNNRRDWFNENKHAYEIAVREPALNFIADMNDELKKISPHFLTVPKKMGGSLMRIYRDVRFGKDKRPYKTNIGIQFRHEVGKDVHAPGFYVHIEPGDCFIGVGIWRPDSAALGKIRERIAEQGTLWQTTINAKPFSKYFSLAGESLVNPPRGYSKAHPLIQDIKRKDFIAIAPFDEAVVTTARFKKMVCDRFAAAESYMQFLCNALEIRF